jgi:Caudovirus prohead protease.
VIDAVGIQTDNFMRNPVILYGHDMKSLPIGRAIALHRTTNSLVAKIQFAVTQNEQAATIWNLVRDGFLTGASIGFQPLASVPFKAKLTPPALAENLRYTRVELLEISIVSVPANTNALKMAVDRGLVSARSLGLLHLRLAPEWQPSSRSLAMMESYFRERYR